MKTIYITEQQLMGIMTYEASQILCEARGRKDGLKRAIMKMLLRGIGVAAIMTALIKYEHIGEHEAMNMISSAQHEIYNHNPFIKTPFNKAMLPGDMVGPRLTAPFKGDEPWELIASDVVATVYNAEPEQCNDDISHTASMFRLNLSDVLAHRIIAMERTMMSRFGLKYGDVVKLEGTGKYDGVWQIQDTMNKRFAGQNKIDILVRKGDGMGIWKDVKVYKLTNPELKDKFKNDMEPQLTKAESKKQAENIRNGNFAV